MSINACYHYIKKIDIYAFRQTHTTYEIVLQKAENIHIWDNWKFKHWLDI